METGMQAVAEILGRVVRVTMSAAARRELSRRETPLVAEMELYFSCLIRKAVRFDGDARGAQAVPAGEYLRVAFRPVMSQGCAVDPESTGPALADMPLANPQAFVPKWLDLDYRGGRWSGDFGFD